MSSEADLRESEALTSDWRRGSVKRRKWIRRTVPLKPQGWPLRMWTGILDTSLIFMVCASRVVLFSETRLNGRA